MPLLASTFANVLGKLNTKSKQAKTTASSAFDSGAILWNQQDLAVLLANERSHSRCYIKFSGQPRPYQTLLIGFDLAANQVLLDDLFPAPPVEMLAGSEPLTICLTTASGELELVVVIQERVRTPSGPALLANVSGKQFNACRRMNRSIDFADHQGPAVHLLFAPGLALQGTLLTLSSEEMWVKTYGVAPAGVAQSHPRGDSQIIFHEQFKLKCKVQLKHWQHLRKPCFHSHLRLSFQQLSLRDQEKLNGFITAYGADDELRVAC